MKFLAGGFLALSLFFVGGMALVPAPTFAQSQVELKPLVPCDGLSCQACHVVKLIDNIIKFLIVIAIPIVAILFAWAGILYFSSGASEGNIGKAKEIFSSAFIGFIIALTAFIVVDVIIRTLVEDKAIGKWGSIQCVSNRPGTSTDLPVR